MYHGLCGATSDADCAASNVCKSSHWCRARDGECVE